MIFELENALLRLCDTASAHFTAYRNELDGKAKSDKKTVTSEHYKFLCSTADISKQLDEVLLKISAELKRADIENDPQKTKSFTSLFQRGMLLKNTLDDFFRCSEDALKEEDILAELKKLTEATLRKTINIKVT